MYRLLSSLTLLLLLLLPKLAFATYPDISGNYAGTVNINRSGCPDTADNGIDSGTLSLVLSGNTNGTFTGSGSGSDSDGSFSFIIEDGFNTDTSFNFNLKTTTPGDPAGTGSVSGTFNDTTITFTGTVIDDCTSNVSGTLTRSSGPLASANTPGSTITDTLLFNVQIQNTVQGISSRIGGALNSIRSVLTPRFTDNQFKLEGTTGLNAGDGMGVPYGVWGNYSYTDFENDLSSTAFDGSSHGFLGGIDFQVWEGTVLGVALGYDKSDIDTGFNRGNQDTDTITIAPYFGALISDVLSLDFNIGYSYVDYDQFRTAGITRVNSSPSADRWFGAFNLNAITFVDRWVIGGRVGLLYASSVIDNYSESDGNLVNESRTKVGTVSIAGDVAYSFNEWEPFLNLAYQYDYQLQKLTAAVGPQPSNDQDDILLTTGLRYFEKSGVSGNLEYSKRLLRDNYDEDRISLTVRIDY